MAYVQKEPAALKVLPFIVGKTLGKVLGSVHLAALWGILQMTPKSFQEKAARVGFTPGPTLGEELFQKMIDHPEGIWVGQVDGDNNFEALQTEDGRINLFIPELIDTVRGIDADAEGSGP